MIVEKFRLDGKAAVVTDSGIGLWTETCYSVKKAEEDQVCEGCVSYRDFSREAID